MSGRPEHQGGAPGGNLETEAELQRCLSDLVGLLALPALWDGRPPEGVLDVLFDALGSMLTLHLAYARVPTLEASPALERARAAGQVVPLERIAALHAQLDRVLAAPPCDPVDLELAPDLGSERCRAVRVPLGFYSGTGLIVLASCDPDFPTRRDLVLIRAATSLATAGIESARRLEQRRRLEQQLWSLAEAALSILAAGSLEDIAAEAARQARRLIGAQRALVRLAPGAVGSGAAAPLEREDPAPRAPAAAAAPRALAGAAPTLRPPPPSFQVEVLSREGGHLGVLHVEHDAGAPLTESDRAVLAQLAQAVASAVEHTRLVAAAREGDRRKDEFLALLGHELRNPLAPIVTALQLMKMRGDGQGARERQVIERQVRHMIQLVDDLLDIARVTRGKLELRAERVELAAVVDRAIEMASPLIEQRRHLLRVSVPRAGLEIDADPARLAQVFANLLTNAARYTDPGGAIEVSARRDGEAVIAAVRDTGHGLAPDLLEAIFEPFVQVGRQREALAGGLGLGLPLVRSLVELHGGRVRAESDGPGRGSTFVVELPASRRLAAPAEAAPGPAPDLLLPADRRRRVLVVDDNQDAGQLVAEVLSTLGHHVELAHDGAEALDLAARFRPEVAVLDIGLPVMDGHELGRHLRALLGDGIRLIALTGYGQESDQERSHLEGFAAHLVKPIDIDVLSAAVSAVSAVSAVTGASAASAASDAGAVSGASAAGAESGASGAR